MATTFREVVKVLSQSEGLDERPPYIREQPLVQGVGSDVQAFGYDESAVPEPDRAALRVESRARMWRVYRQELFLKGDSEPFGVVEWKHTLNRIEVVRVTARGLEPVIQHGAIECKGPRPRAHHSLRTRRHVSSTETLSDQTGD